MGGGEKTRFYKQSFLKKSQGFLGEFRPFKNRFLGKKKKKPHLKKKIKQGGGEKKTLFFPQRPQKISLFFILDWSEKIKKLPKNVKKE